MTLRSRVTKAVIPAAGLGTRFLPATKAMPKEMLPVVDKPAIQYVVQEAVDAGLSDVLMITGRNKRALEDHFDRVPFIEQTLEAKGDLDKLAAGGYLEVVSGRVAGARAGRPSKRYVVVADALKMNDVDFPVRSDDLLLSLLGRALDRLPDTCALW